MNSYPEPVDDRDPHVIRQKVVEKIRSAGNYRDTHFKISHQRSVFITFVSHGNHNLGWVSLQFC